MASRCHLFGLISLLLCSWFAYGQASSASTADWVVTVNTKVVDKCLDYPDSKLKPLIRSSVHLEQALLEPTQEDRELAKKVPSAAAVEEEPIPPTLYENIYSSHFRAVGLRRFKQMIIKPGTTGTIKISSSNITLAQEQANAAAITTVRLYLDLYLNKMPLRSILVPREMFDMFVQEMQRYGFRTASIMPGQISNALIMLSIRSEPAGRQQYMSYGM